MVGQQVRFMLIEMSPDGRRTRAVTPELASISDPSVGYKSRPKNYEKHIKKYRKHKISFFFWVGTCTQNPGTEIGTKIQSSVLEFAWNYFQNLGSNSGAESWPTVARPHKTQSVPSFGDRFRTNFWDGFRPRFWCQFPYQGFGVKFRPKKI